MKKKIQMNVDIEISILNRSEFCCRSDKQPNDFELKMRITNVCKNYDNYLF